MYRLTPRMLQKLEHFLIKYHDLIAGSRCQSFELEELIVKAIKSDFTVPHQVYWTEVGHDSKADIRVRTNGMIHEIQIKSGAIRGGNKQVLTISGYRLTTYKNDFNAIANYLNSKKAEYIAIPYEQINNEKGRTHKYQVAYVASDIITGVSDKWEEYGKQYRQINSYDVELSIRPSMSWQIWWNIPLKHVILEEPFLIN